MTPEKLIFWQNLLQYQQIQQLPPDLDEDIFKLSLSDPGTLKDNDEEDPLLGQDDKQNQEDENRRETANQDPLAEFEGECLEDDNAQANTSKQLDVIAASMLF